MFQSGQRVATRVATRERLENALRHRALLVRAEIAVGSPDMARIGLIVSALGLQTLVLFSPGHFRPAGSAGFALQVCLGTLASLGLSLMATTPLKTLFSTRVRQALGLLGLTLLCVLPVIGVERGVSQLVAMYHGPPYNNDGAVMDLYAAEQVRHGRNPYLKVAIVPALASINAPSITTTPLMSGQFRGARAYPSEEAVQQVFLNVLRYRPRTIPPEFESKYNYPAGSFLFILPFVWMGMHDMRFLYGLAIVGMAAYLWWRMPRPLRPLVPLAILADVPLIMLTTGGQPDPLYGLFLMVGLAEWRSPRLSPIAVGLAVATKQLAWFFLPFYLLLIARHIGVREASRRAGITIAIFLALNGPFILQSPAAYVASLAGPMADPMFPLGIGIVALFVSNLLPILPKAAFTVTELVAWLCTLAAFGRIRALTPASMAVLGAVPLFFAWRSLVNYFYLVPLLTLAIVLAERRLQTGTVPRPLS